MDESYSLDSKDYNLREKSSVLESFETDPFEFTIQKDEDETNIALDPTDFRSEALILCESTSPNILRSISYT